MSQNYGALDLYFSNIREVIPTDLTEADQLVLDNLKVVVKIAHKYSNIKNIDLDDLVQIGNIGLIKASRTFDKSKGNQFLTYAVTCINNEIRMAIIFNKRHSNCVSIDDVDLSADDSFVDDLELASLYEQVNTIVGMLPPKYQDILNNLYGLNHHKRCTQKELGRRLNLSQSWICRTQKKALLLFEIIYTAQQYDNTTERPKTLLYK